MNKFVKISIILLGMIIIVGGGIYVKLFMIGGIAYDDVVIEKVSVNSNEVVITGNLSSSSDAYKDFDYQLVGSELYVNIKSVMVSNKYKDGVFKIVVPENGMKIDNIHISDGTKTKVVYSKGSPLE